MRIQLIDAGTTAGSTDSTGHVRSPGAGTATLIPVGVQVELRSRFDDRWTHGFSIAVCGDGEYQVRRLSDGHVLPAWFPASMLRPILES